MWLLIRLDTLVELNDLKLEQDLSRVHDCIEGWGMSGGQLNLDSIMVKACALLYSVLGLHWRVSLRRIYRMSRKPLLLGPKELVARCPIASQDTTSSCITTVRATSKASAASVLYRSTWRRDLYHSLEAERRCRRAINGRRIYWKKSSESYLRSKRYWEDTWGRVVEKCMWNTVTLEVKTSVTSKDYWFVSQALT